LPVALEHLQETAVIEQQHAGDIVQAVLRPGRGQDLVNQTRRQRIGRLAGIDQTHQHHRAPSGQ